MTQKINLKWNNFIERRSASIKLKKCFIDQIEKKKKNTQHSILKIVKKWWTNKIKIIVKCVWVQQQSYAIHREIIHVDLVFKIIVTFEKQINEIQRNQVKFGGMFHTNIKIRDNLLIFFRKFSGCVKHTPKYHLGFSLFFFERKMKNTKNFGKKCVIFYKGKSFVLN